VKQVLNKYLLKDLMERPIVTVHAVTSSVWSTGPEPWTEGHPFSSHKTELQHLVSDESSFTERQLRCRNNVNR